MGTDIHLIVEHKVNGEWRKIDPPDDYPRSPWILEQIAKYEKMCDDDKFKDGMYKYYLRKRDCDWYSNRCYDLFAILADVRNGSGFAGIKTGNGYKPISKPKGLPKDCTVGNEDYGLGDHSFSWLTVKELIDFDWNQETENCGVISWEEYKKRIANNITTAPESYCGDYWGPNVVVIEEADVKYHAFDETKRNHIRIWWKEKYCEASQTFYNTVIPALKKIDPDPENVRIVFGFDS